MIFYGPLLPAAVIASTAPAVPAPTPPPPVSDGTFIWNWLYGRKRKKYEAELPEEVIEAAEEVAEAVQEKDESALYRALEALESALAAAVARNKALVERTLYAQIQAAIAAEQEKLRRLQIARLEAHLSERAAWRAMVDAEAQEVLELIDLL